MPEYSTIKNKLGAPLNKTETIADVQSTDDIIKELPEAHKIFARDYHKIAPAFAVPNRLLVLFKFVQDNLRYKEESGFLQTAASPAKILELAETRGVDCKHYTLFILGVLDAMRREKIISNDIELIMRFAAYDENAKSPGHVFPVVVLPDGSEIWLDAAPVRGLDGRFKSRFFNDRLIFPTLVLDIIIQPMALQRISGIGAAYKSIPDSPPCVGFIDPIVAVAVSKKIISKLPEGGLKNFIGGFISDPTGAVLKLFARRNYPTGQYALGEWYMRNILGQYDIQTRAQVPDEMVVQGSQFWTLALGVPVSSTDHIDQLRISPQSYKQWAGGFFSYVPDQQAERASAIVKSIGIPPTVRNSTIDLRKFNEKPYIYPLFDLPLTDQTAGTFYTGTHPITNEKIVSGYPSGTIDPKGTGPGGTDGDGQTDWKKILLYGALALGGLYVVKKIL